MYVNLYTVYDTVRQRGGNVLTERKEGQLGLIVPPLELWRFEVLGCLQASERLDGKAAEYPLVMSNRQTNNNQGSSLEWISFGAVCRVACMDLA